MLEPTPATSLYTALDQLLSVLARHTSGTAAQEALGWLVQGDADRARTVLDRLPDDQIQPHLDAAGALADLLTGQARRRSIPLRTPAV